MYALREYIDVHAISYMRYIVDRRVFCEIATRTPPICIVGVRKRADCALSERTNRAFATRTRRDAHSTEFYRDKIIDESLRRYASSRDHIDYSWSTSM
jgi:hypothetical protein